MQAHTKSFIFAMMLNKILWLVPASLTRNYGTSILPSQLNAWLGTTSELLTLTGCLAGCWFAYQPMLCGPSVSIQQPPATFQVTDCLSIWPECAATSAPPKLASPQTSISQLSTAEVAGGRAGRGAREEQITTYHTRRMPGLCAKRPYCAALGRCATCEDFERAAGVGREAEPEQGYRSKTKLFILHQGTNFELVGVGWIRETSRLEFLLHKKVNHVIQA
jgi:hypothetical protein